MHFKPKITENKHNKNLYNDARQLTLQCTELKQTCNCVNPLIKGDKSNNI